MVPDHTRGAHPTASGRLKTVVLFRQSYPALTNGGVDNAVVPCGTGALVTQTTLRTLRQLSATWARDFHFEQPNFEFDEQQFYVIEGSCRSRPALEELDGQQFFAIEGS